MLLGIPIALGSWWGLLVIAAMMPADAERFKLHAPVDRWRRVRDHMHATICELGFDAGRNAFMQSFGSGELDASLLLMPVVGFLPPDDPRVRGTVAAIEQELMVDGLVLRYRTKAGIDDCPVFARSSTALQIFLGRNLRWLHGCCQRSVDDRLGFGEDPAEMVQSAKALPVNPVNIFGARRTRCKPATFGNHLQPPDRCTVARSLRKDGLDFLAGQLRGKYLLWRELRQPLLLLRARWRLNTIVSRFAELARQLTVDFAGITAHPRSNL
jgi:Glycosyl hydrolases family 15